MVPLKAVGSAAFLCLLVAASPRLVASEVVNDVTQLNPIVVDRVVRPVSIEEISDAVRGAKQAVSIGGARKSQGGQIALEDSLHIDMRGFNKVVAFDPEQKVITVQAGITWRDIQDKIDPYNLSVSIMQTYSNFTVGGALSVNCHGRYVNAGPLILSVKAIKVVLADGTIVDATPTSNSDIFYGAIGGYGGIGIIAEATLKLTDNSKVERSDKVMPIGQYKDYFFNNVRNSPTAVFHNGDIYPPSFDTVRAVTWSKSDKPVTLKDHMIGRHENYWLDRQLIWIISEVRIGKWLRQHVIDPIIYLWSPVVWRNHEASYDVAELEPASRARSTYVLQEYFIPVGNFDEFHPKMAEIFTRHRVNVLNVSIRHAHGDPGSLMAWARSECFAFVVYYKQGTSQADRAAVGVWTRELIDASLSVGGSYYLPYQVLATPEQFRKAYPRFGEFLNLKRRVDPQHKFRNKLWDAYDPVPGAASSNGAAPASKFKRLFADTKIHDGVYLFLQNVYGLYPEKDFFGLISEEIRCEPTDQAIYEGIQRRIGEVTPMMWSLRRALTALVKQKRVIARQTEELLGSGTKINGYAEIGTPGRHFHGLGAFLEFSGPMYVVYDSRPSFSLEDIMERGQITRLGEYVPLDDYAPIPADRVADSSLDLVTVYIGLHHCPPARLDAFVGSIRRVLRPGGRLVLRDHDAVDQTTWDLIDFIHDIFYAGLGKPWSYDSTEQRHFTSCAHMAEYLKAQGFEDSGKRLHQDHDPSLNTLMLYTKEGKPPL
jgi:FAD/FMN-containing dehydrogenase/SAM-dependent methyltransferase